MTDTISSIKCPACGSKMTKIFIEDGGFNIDICAQGCGGIFFDNRELDKFTDKTTSVDEIISEIKQKEFKPVDTTDVRICPICKVPMVKMGSGVEDVEIDVCNSCGAKFLDDGELEKIRNATTQQNEMVDELIQYLYQKELKDMLGKNYGKRPITGAFRTALEKVIYRNIVK